MAGEKVACPICGKRVAEGDINLHLDLQCSGTAEGSRSTIVSSPVASTSQLSHPSAQHPKKTQRANDDVIVFNDAPTPLKSQNRPGASTPVASIFGGGRSRPEDTPEGSQGGTEAKRGLKRPAWGDGVKRESMDGGVFGEKKAKQNPLLANQPLAERSRPTTLDAYIGQDDLIGPGSLLRARIEVGEGVGSCILWGPPGCGKTTMARLIARTANAEFKELSATSAGTADVRQVFEQAKNGLKLTGRKTILMVDEIHRFNRSQQDLFLPYVENGWVQLIGATTENPSFKVNGALLSRCQVFTLSAHTPESLQTILNNALASYPTPPAHLPPDLIPFLADVADGDARQALNGLELALKVCESSTRQTTLDGPAELNEEGRKKRDTELMDTVRKGLRKGYDRTGEERYDMISAMHKCIRGSDGSAAMYWLARMITGGEDALYIARRLIVCSSEDIGMSDPHALPLAMATYQACQMVGLPECRINLAHCVAYLSEAPKSTRSYTAYKRAEALAKETPLPPVPLQIRNAPTRLMKTLGYGKEYSYDPDYAHPVRNEYLPPALAEYSSHAPDPAKRILRSYDVEQSGKTWDEKRLAEWESEVNAGEKWEGRGQKARREWNEGHGG